MYPTDSEGVDCEGQPGAPHVGPDAPCVNGPHDRRRPPLALTLEAHERSGGQGLARLVMGWVDVTIVTRSSGGRALIGAAGRPAVSVVSIRRPAALPATPIRGVVGAVARSWTAP